MPALRAVLVMSAELTNKCMKWFLMHCVWRVSISGYLADWVAHFAYDSKDWSEVPNIPTFRRWFGNGFNQADGDELQQLLRCHRRWAQSARVVATSDCARIAASPNPSRSALTSHVRVKAARWIEDLSPHELTSLFYLENPI
jgi:hypothetical protein